MKRFLLDRRMYVEYAVAAVLFAANVLLALFMPYLTEHKRYYDSNAYIAVLAIAFLLYTAAGPPPAIAQPFSTLLHPSLPATSIILLLYQTLSLAPSNPSDCAK